MIVVLDTCAVLWFTLEPDALSLKAQKSISSAEAIIVSAISIWEIGIKSVRNQLELGTSYDDYADRLSRTSELTIEPLLPQILVDSVLLPWEHRDPADRMIVALARSLDASLITDDRTIKEFYKRSVF